MKPVSEALDTCPVLPLFAWIHAPALALLEPNEEAVMGKALSEKQIKQFRDDGFLSPIRFLDEAEALGYLARLQTFEQARPELVGKLDFKANLLLDWIDGLARRDHILDIIEDLLGPDILNWNATFRFKNPDGKAHAAWHQDSM